MRVAKPFAALDTNVIVSGTLAATSPPGQIMTVWQTNQIQVALSPPLLAEVKRVLARPYFAQRGWSTARASQFAARLRASAVMVPGTTPVDVCQDPTDNSLFACAVEADVDYVVSGDTRHVLPIGSYQGIPAVSPRAFMATLEQTRQVA